MQNFTSITNRSSSVSRYTIADTIRQHWLCHSWICSHCRLYHNLRINDDTLNLRQPSKTDVSNCQTVFAVAFCAIDTYSHKYLQLNTTKYQFEIRHKVRLLYIRIIKVEIHATLCSLRHCLYTILFTLGNAVSAELLYLDISRFRKECTVES